ncbi:MAG: adenylosuccinate lyase [Firmicutes bacterium]|nr:adenylosuccinate lyase [Bacillota bacterium]
MISRYQRQVFKELWSEQNRYDAFLKVELEASSAWHVLGLIPDTDFESLKKATFNLKDITRFEEEVKHDVIAFTKAVSLSLGDEKKWVHYGLTSTDVVDTAQSIILRDVNNIIKNDIDLFKNVLKQKALLYKHTPIIGRTHGIHAEITSFGLKFALWYEDFKRLSALFNEAAQHVEIVKLSGAVGNYSATTPQLEEIVSKSLGLKSANVATQTLQRDRHAHYMSVIALVGSELEKIAVEIRHLSRTEIGEVSENFDSSQKGSSAMPHKKNPISSENICGLSRVLKGYMVASFDNIALWHERDISHSSVERIILPDATSLLDYMLNRYANTLNRLVVHDQKMLENIYLTQGVIFTQSVLHLLIDKGLNREAAYDLVQKIALSALSTQTSFLSLLLENEEINKIVSKDELALQFGIEKHLRFVDQIYSKVF